MKACFFLAVRALFLMVVLIGAVWMFVPLVAVCLLICLPLAAGKIIADTSVVFWREVRGYVRRWKERVSERKG